MDLFGKTFVVNPDFVFREEESGAFLFNPKTDSLHCVNLVGAFICRLCDGRNDLGRIVQKLFEEFDVKAERARVKEDIEKFVTRMTKLNLLEVQE